ncbi:uncharacterized protein LOC131043591 [Cryptomeria japonica]|uniref:uncharacterized protein LOC131043591 n=1 Tax=Cryptomeria japonica TaxID=3369 RepID=UPI0027DA0D14|nr:uncharacterized protein LOC131043591 [Cryptomeria japonica]
MAESEIPESAEGLNGELAEPLKHMPPVEFAFAYGSGVFPQPGRVVKDEEPMVDYILGVADPIQWHTENLQRNRDHYSFIMAHFGSKTVTEVAEKIGVGVHFNAFVPWKDKKIKYGVIRMHWLIRDVLNWDSLYISGRLQKPVHILRDNLNLENVNAANLKGATAAALLLLPPEFSEEDLFVKICGLSYMGDLRMFFAEDIHKVKKIVHGNINSFHTLYKDQIYHVAETGLLKLPSSAGDLQKKIIQDFSVSTTRSLVSALPPAIRSRMGAELGEKITINNFGREVSEVLVKTREDAANSMQRAIKSIVRVSSLRQALSGCLAAGGVNAASYLAKKVLKAWRSR